MDDLDRLRAEYARRATDSRYADWYSPTNPANRFITQDRDRAIVRLLAQNVQHDWKTGRVLDLGCGNGNELIKFIGYGADAQNLHGIDLLDERIQQARVNLSDLQFACGNAAQLPYPDSTFDLIMQFTVFTSILDAQLKQHIAAEMLRVLKSNGSILWYDYWLNPTNRQTRGIDCAEITKLFSNCDYQFRRITLAPPLVRWLAPRSISMCAALNHLPFLKTHWLGLITKKS